MRNAHTYHTGWHEGIQCGHYLDRAHQAGCEADHSRRVLWLHAAFHHPRWQRCHCHWYIALPAPRGDGTHSLACTMAVSGAVKDEGTSQHYAPQELAAVVPSHFVQVGSCASAHYTHTITAHEFLLPAYVLWLVDYCVCCFRDRVWWTVRSQLTWET